MPDTDERVRNKAITLIAQALLLGDEASADAAWEYLDLDGNSHSEDAESALRRLFSAPAGMSERERNLVVAAQEWCDWIDSDNDGTSKTFDDELEMMERLRDALRLYHGTGQAQEGGAK